MPDIDPYLLHLVRDSRGVAYSYTKTVVAEAYFRGKIFRMDRRTAMEASLRWSFHNALISGLRRHYRHAKFLRYEDLVARPRETLSDLLKWVGVTNSLAFIRGKQVDLKPNHILGGNPMRAKVGGVNIKLDDAWRVKLGCGRRVLVTALTWPLLKCYGY